MSMCKGPLGTLRGPWGGSGQHVTLGEGGGGGASGQHVTLGGGPLVNMLHWGGGGGGGLCM